MQRFTITTSHDSGKLDCISKLTVRTYDFKTEQPAVLVFFYTYSVSMYICSVCSSRTEIANNGPHHRVMLLGHPPL